MAKSIVNRLELIEIYVNYRQLPTLSFGQRHGLLQAIGKQDPVWHARQGIVMRHDTEPSFLLLESADVTEDAYKMGDFAMITTHTAEGHR